MIRDVYPGSRISDPGPGFFPIPDPWAKQKALHPGSTTLLVTIHGLQKLKPWSHSRLKFWPLWTITSLTSKCVNLRTQILTSHKHSPGLLYGGVTQF
jgi:hypothetical protein